MMRRILLIGSLGAAIALTIAGNLLVLDAMTAWGLDAGSLIAFVNAIGVLGITSTIVGALICLRVPGNPIGPVLIVGALTIMSVFVAWPLVVVRDAAGAGVPAIDGVVAWWGIVALLPGIFLIGPTVGTLFPDGRLPGRRWRPSFVAVVGILATGVLLQTVAPWAIGEDSQPVANPFAIPGVPEVVNEVGGAVAAVGVFAGFALAVAAIMVRFRRSAYAERAQLKWLSASLAVMAVVFPVSFATDEGPAELIDLASVLAGALIPTAIGVAILRYRLYDIDRIISRTLSYAVVTAVLGGVFVSVVLLLQAVLSSVTQGETLAVAASTLVAFALFQPLRRRVQHIVDRRFDRARIDADRTVALFAERLRDEVDIAQVLLSVSQTTEDAVRPDRVGVWLRSARDGAA